MESIYEGYRDRAAFFVVYIREAHPSDGWQVGANKSQGIIFEQPMTLEERKDVAHTCQLGLDISIPILIDDIDNTVERAYAAWPDRLYVVSREGRIGYKGGVGPGGFKPQAMEKSLKNLVAD